MLILQGTAVPHVHKAACLAYLLNYCQFKLHVTQIKKLLCAHFRIHSLMRTLIQALCTHSSFTTYHCNFIFRYFPSYLADNVFVVKHYWTWLLLLSSISFFATIIHSLIFKSAVEKSRMWADRKQNCWYIFWEYFCQLWNGSWNVLLTILEADHRLWKNVKLLNILQLYASQVMGRKCEQNKRT